MRRTLLVPMRGAIAERAPPAPRTRERLSPAAGRTTASRGSSRGSTAADRQPLGQDAGMSLLLWTARSISPASSASSISLTNSRLPPISDSGASASRSPDVLMTTISHSTPAWRGAAPRRRWLERARAGCRACRARSGHVRSRSGRTVLRERRRRCVFVLRRRNRRLTRFGVGGLRLFVGQRLELLGRLEQQLLDDQPRDLVDARARLGRQRRRACLRAAAARRGGWPRTAGAAPRPSAPRRASAATP